MRLKFLSTGTPVLLLPLALAHTKHQLPGRAIVVAMIGAGATSGIWLLLGRGDPWLGVEAIFPGLVVSLGVIVSARFFRR